MDPHEPQYGYVPDDTQYNLNDRFNVVRTLGEGMYGKVKLAVDLNTNKKVLIISTIIHNIYYMYYIFFNYIY